MISKVGNLSYKRTTFNPNAGAQSLELLGDLEGQLSGGREDERVEPLRRRQQ